MSKRGGYEILAAEISEGAETEVPRRVVTSDLETIRREEDRLLARTAAHVQTASGPGGNAGLPRDCHFYPQKRRIITSWKNGN